MLRMYRYKGNTRKSDDLGGRRLPGEITGVGAVLVPMKVARDARGGGVTEAAAMSIEEVQKMLLVARRLTNRTYDSSSVKEGKRKSPRES